jgi:hypothetical protein
MGFGFHVLCIHSRQLIRWVSVAVLSVLIVAQGAQAFPRSSKRWSLYARDYVENVFRSTPRNGIIVFHEDVQLFSLWQAQLVKRRRPDISIVALGLAGSPWYWDMMARWNVAMAPEVAPRQPGGWEKLVREAALAPGMPRPVLVGYETEVQDIPVEKRLSRGFVFELRTMEPPPSLLVTPVLPAFCLYRGLSSFGRTPDFFSSDLLADAARAHIAWAVRATTLNRFDEAFWYLKRAEALDPNFVEPYAYHAYAAFKKGDFAEAYRLYGQALRKHAAVLDNARRYRSLPAVVQGVRSDMAASAVSAGACAERLGRVDEARRHYETALEVHPTAQAHYNMAVTYWGRDWSRVIAHLEAALRLDPKMTEAAGYLESARRRATEELKTRIVPPRDLNEF